jgi:hypothetical protein
MTSHHAARRGCSCCTTARAADRHEADTGDDELVAAGHALRYGVNGSTGSPRARHEQRRRSPAEWFPGSASRRRTGPLGWISQNGMIVDHASDLRLLASSQVRGVLTATLRTSLVCLPSTTETPARTGRDLRGNRLASRRERAPAASRLVPGPVGCTRGRIIAEQEWCDHSGVTRVPSRQRRLRRLPAAVASVRRAPGSYPWVVTDPAPFPRLPDGFGW